MSKRYYSPSTGGFYSEMVHGARLIDQELTAREMKAGKRARQEPNPLCRIPADAVEISDARHAELMAAQAAGQMIVADPARAVPVNTVPRATSAAERRAARLAQRNRLLDACMWVLDPDALADRPADREAVQAYRSALRGIDPNGTDWPTMPDCLTS